MAYSWRMDDLSHSDDTASNFREVGPDILSTFPIILDDVKATLTPERCQSAVDFGPLGVRGHDLPVLVARVPTVHFAVVLRGKGPGG